MTRHNDNGYSLQPALPGSNLFLECTTLAKNLFRDIKVIKILIFTIIDEKQSHILSSFNKYFLALTSKQLPTGSKFVSSEFSGIVSLENFVTWKQKS